MKAIKEARCLFFWLHSILIKKGYSKFYQVSMPEVRGSDAMVRIVVAGDSGSGKTSLILTEACRKFQENLGPIILPSYCNFDSVTIIDTSSR